MTNGARRIGEGCRKVEKDYNSCKRASDEEVETLSNKDRWRGRLNEREGKVDDFSAYKGHEKVAMEGKKGPVRI